MAKKKAADKEHRLRGPGPDTLEAAQAEHAGDSFVWHYGRITRMSHYEIAGPGVTIAWEEGVVTSQQGSITDEQWEIFRLAFMTSGRVAILSDLEGEAWTYDYRFLEAIR